MELYLSLQIPYKTYHLLTHSIYLFLSIINIFSIVVLKFLEFSISVIRRSDFTEFLFLMGQFTCFFTIFFFIVYQSLKNSEKWNMMLFLSFLFCLEGTRTRFNQAANMRSVLLVILTSTRLQLHIFEFTSDFKYDIGALTLSFSSAPDFLCCCYNWRTNKFLWSSQDLNLEGFYFNFNWLWFTYWFIFWGPWTWAPWNSQNFFF